MALTPTQRMAAYRSRQRAAGFATVSLLVPKHEVAGFQRLASLRRRKGSSLSAARSLHSVWFAQNGLEKSDDIDDGRRLRARASGGQSRSAEVVAERLLKHIIVRGWEKGTSLGSEAGLMKMLSVSRTMLHRAMRILESYSVIQTRRGASGEYTVRNPSAAEVGRAVGIYLEYRRITSEDILAARKMLEQTMVSLAVKRLTAAGARRITVLLEAEAHLDGTASSAALQRFHVTVGELSGNPALRLFGEVVLRLSEAHSTFTRHSRAERDRIVNRIKTLHRRIGEAMIADSAQTAHDLVGRYLSGYRQWME